jgi:hypothetical protein
MTYTMFNIKRVNYDEERVWASWESDVKGRKLGPIGFGETMVEAIDDRERLEARLHTLDIWF